MMVSILVLPIHLILAKMRPSLQLLLLVSSEIFHYLHNVYVWFTLFHPVPPVVNRSDVVNNPGNCLDLTHDLFNVQRVGAEMCVRAGKPALLILQCKILDGIPKPTVKWLKDGRSIAGVLQRISYIDASENLTLLLGSEAYGKSKREIEGNYTCVASNIAGTIAVSSYVTLFGGT